MTAAGARALAWRPGLNAARAAALAAGLAWLGPPGGGLAAHVFQRNLFLHHGFALWTNYWYAGRYSFVGYSLIYYPLAAWIGIKLLAVLSVAGATAAFTVVAERTWGSAAVWAARLFGVAAAAAVISAAFGENVARLRFAAVPLAVLTLSLRRWQPLPYAIGVLALAFSWNATPLAYSFARTASDPSASKAYWQPVIGFLHKELTPDYRVEAVDTAGHWEAVSLAQARIPIVRGWFRQGGFPQNELLYDPFGRRAYLAWLHPLGAGSIRCTGGPQTSTRRT